MTKERVEEVILLYQTQSHVKKTLSLYRQAYIEALEGEEHFLGLGLSLELGLGLDKNENENEKVLDRNLIRVPKEEQLQVISETLSLLNNQLKFEIPLSTEDIAELTEFFHNARFSGKNAMMSLRNWYKLRDKHLESYSSSSSFKKKKLHDGSNLGQSAYTYLLIAVQEYLKRCTKIQTFSEWLLKDEHSLAEWFIFGRVPWLETRLGKYYHVKRQYSINLIHGSRRTVDKSLPETFQLKTPLSIPSNIKLQQAMSKATESILLKFANNTNTNTNTEVNGNADVNVHVEKPLTERQRVYQRKLAILKPHYPLVANILIEEFFKPKSNSQTKTETNSPSRWYLLKNAAKRVYHELNELNQTNKKLLASYNERSFFSILRNFVVTALVSLKEFKHKEMTVFQYALINECLNSEKLLVKPFQSKKKNKKTRTRTRKNKLPLKLEMSPKYVVIRPGNSKVLTELALKQQQFPITLKQGKGRSALKITTKILIHSKLREYLNKGAKIATVILRSGPAPAYKLQAQVTIKGEEWMFYSTIAIQQAPWIFQRTKKQVLQPVTLPNVNTEDTNTTIRPIALDINRPHKKMLAFSEKADQPIYLNTIIEHYLTLEEQLKPLNKKLSKLIEQDLTNNGYTAIAISNLKGYKRWKADKLIGEINRIYERRKRLLKNIHLEGSQFTASALVQGNYNVFGIEDLDISARNTKGALAKAILSMPDEQQLYTRATALAQLISNQYIALESVDPHYSSQAKHLDCPAAKPGKLKRGNGQKWDDVTCDACGQLVNTHDHSALVLRNRTYNQYIERVTKTNRKTTRKKITI